MLTLAGLPYLYVNPPATPFANPYAQMYGLDPQSQYLRASLPGIKGIGGKVDRQPVGERGILNRTLNS